MEAMPWKPPEGEPIHITPEGIERLRERHARLKKSLPALAVEAARTAEYGDRSDNAEYKQAKGALRYTQREVYRLEDQLKRAVPILRVLHENETIQLGSRIIVERIGTNEKKIFEILGPHETDPAKGRISDKSPLGAALMGRAAGDVVKFESANGPQTYRIVEVK
jgi:transcription elongation GreA/GreB family factor